MKEEEVKIKALEARVCKVRAQIVNGGLPELDTFLRKVADFVQQENSYEDAVKKVHQIYDFAEVILKSECKDKRTWRMVFEKMEAQLWSYDQLHDNHTTIGEKWYKVNAAWGKLKKKARKVKKGRKNKK